MCSNVGRAGSRKGKARTITDEQQAPGGGFSMEFEGRLRGSRGKAILERVDQKSGSLEDWESILGDESGLRR